MVCTDRASRGVDFGGSAAPVGHVVLFDWPRDPAEFLRRVGRTARAGRGGRCTALVVGSRQVALARAVADAAKGGRRLSAIDERQERRKRG
jgi:ATP-dependent RNA helicase DDX18/HAS1